MAIRTLTAILTWDDPGDEIQGNVNPFSLHFRFAVYSKDTNGNWVLRHDTGLTGITEYNDQGGTGWTDHFGTEYDDTDPNAEFYCQLITIESITSQGGTIYNVNHDTKTEMVDCNSEDDAVFHLDSWDVSTSV